MLNHDFNYFKRQRIAEWYIVCCTTEIIIARKSHRKIHLVFAKFILFNMSSNVEMQKIDNLVFNLKKIKVKLPLIYLFKFHK